MATMYSTSSDANSVGFQPERDGMDRSVLTENPVCDPGPTVPLKNYR